MSTLRVPNKDCEIHFCVNVFRLVPLSDFVLSLHREPV